MEGLLPATITTASGLELVVAEVNDDDHDELFDEFNDVLAAGEGYPQAGPISWMDFVDYWLAHKAVVVVARRTDDATFVGSYYLKPNGYGRAAHVANGGYFVVASQRGAGAGTALVEHSMALAPAYGFDALQYNFVFESNPARRLYERLGFEVVGRVPDVIDGEAVLIYWRRL